MKNYIPATFLLTFIVVGALMGLYFLPPMSVGGKTLRKVDLLADIRPDVEEEVCDSDTIVLPPPVKPIFVDTCKTGITCIEDYSDSTMRGMKHFYEALSKVKTMKRPVRIAYFGDSFIEADIFTADLREMLQQEFVGCGVGYVPVTSSISGYRPTVRHTFGGWSSHSSNDSVGFDKIQQNIGSIRNRGLEISLNTVNFAGERGRFKWTTNFNISFNKSKITGLSGDQDFLVSGIQYPTIDNLYIARVGHPLSEMYGYVYDGVYQYEDFNEVSPGVFVLKNGIPNNTKERNTIQPGDMKLRDINGDGKVTAEDQTVIGHGLPIHTGGFTNNFSYKGFDLSIFFQWSYGNDVINYNRAKLEDLRGQHTNQLASAMNHWTPRVDNGDGTYTEGNYTNYLCAVNRNLTNLNTSRVVEDASFLRLKNVQLGYNFPVKLIKRIGISSLRLYVSGQNLWTWTKYTGYDPEVSTSNSALTRGFDYSAYPKTTSYTFGIKLGL